MTTRSLAQNQWFNKVLTLDGEHRVLCAVAYMQMAENEKRSEYEK